MCQLRERGNRRICWFGKGPNGDTWNSICKLAEAMPAKLTVTTTKGHASANEIRAMKARNKEFGEWVYVNEAVDVAADVAADHQGEHNEALTRPVQTICNNNGHQRK